MSPCSAGGAVTARLLRARRPGRGKPAPIATAGEEYTLVLKGGFSDVIGSYGPGDLQMMEGEMRHNPVSDPGEDCINLAVTTGPLQI